MTTAALKNRLLTRPTSVTAACRHMLATANLWRERARQRRHLAEMSPQMLRDIGVSVSAARAEAGKPFWMA